jgi:acyl carrier protein
MDFVPMNSPMPEPLNADKAIQIVDQTLVNEFELEPSKVHPHARMREDLGLDSLDAVDLIVALEKALRVQIPETVAREMRTVGDVHEYIRRVAGEGQ